MPSSVRHLFAQRNMHTVWSAAEQRWGNRREHGEGPTLTLPSREAAIARGREVARSEGVEHVVHDRDGRVISRQFFGDQSP